MAGPGDSYWRDAWVAVSLKRRGERHDDEWAAPRLGRYTRNGSQPAQPAPGGLGQRLLRGATYTVIIPIRDAVTSASANRITSFLPR